MGGILIDTEMNGSGTRHAIVVIYDFSRPMWKKKQTIIETCTNRQLSKNRYLAKSGNIEICLCNQEFYNQDQGSQFFSNEKATQLKS